MNVTINSSDILPFVKSKFVCAHCRTSARIRDDESGMYCGYCGGPDDSVIVVEGMEFDYSRYPVNIDQSWSPSLQWQTPTV